MIRHRRYRRTCLDAYPIRRERSQNFDNNTANPNFWAGPPLPPLLVIETWQYSMGEWTGVSHANWSAGAYTSHGLPTFELGNPKGQFNIYTSRFNGSPNTLLGTAFIASNIDQTKPFAWSFNIINMVEGSAVGGDKGCDLQFSIGTPVGSSITVDLNATTTGGFSITLGTDFGSPSQVVSLGTPASLTTSFLLLVQNSVATLYQNGSKKIASIAASLSAGTVNVDMNLSAVAGGGSGGLGFSIGTCKLYGTV